MSHNKSQISPIPPEAYGDRFVKFISGLTMTKEEVERDAHVGDQVDGSTTASTRQPSWPISRRSSDKIVEKAEKQAHKTQEAGVHEEPIRDRALSTIRSSSAERSGGVTGATLPVVEEDGEGCSREESIREEKLQNRTFSSSEQLPTVPMENQDSIELTLPIVPDFKRSSMGVGSTLVASGV